MLALFVILMSGCTPLAAEKSAAETAYLSQQLKCVDDNQTKRDIDACRAAVKQQWAVADAGSDGAK